MRKPVAILLSLFLVACLTPGAAFADDAAKDSDAQQAQKKRAAKKTKSATEVLAEQIDELRKTLEAQQSQIQQLQGELSKRDQQIDDARKAAEAADAKAAEANSKAAEVATSTAEVKTTTTALSSDVADLKLGSDTLKGAVQDTQKKIITSEGKIKALSELKFSGDLRLRYEPFFGGGTDANPGVNRHRERYRLRFNVNTKITDDFAVGFSLASGDFGDPISTNQTLSGFFTRKPFSVDKAFGVYNPHYFKPFTLTVGKFAYTWQRTELVWDNDLNPEGASEVLAWNWKDKFLNHFALVGYETPAFEVSGAADTYMTGGQVQTGFGLGPRMKLSLNAGYYDWANADRIAQNQTNGNGSATQGIATSSGGTFGFGGSSDTNNTGLINGQRFFASKFGIFDAIARLDFDTGNKRWPVYALFDYAANTRACSNLPLFEAANLADPTVVIPKCDPHQRHGYWSELKFGQTKNKGDLLLGYTFARIERDAVIAAFDFSDLRQPTNVLMHRVEAYYQAYPHVQIGVTGLIGRQLVTAQSTTPERWLKRWQFDTIFSF